MSSFFYCLCPAFDALERTPAFQGMTSNLMVRVETLIEERLKLHSASQTSNVTAIVNDLIRASES